MPTPKISFLLTAYNFERFIGSAIQSLLAQRGGYDFEIVVVDDASTDRTAEVVRSIKDERVRFFQNEKNLGPIASVNKAYSLTRGEYVCRFDGDDEWHPWFLEETVPILDSRPEVGFVYGDIAQINDDGETTVEITGVPDYSQLDKRLMFKELLLDYHIPAPAIIARRTMWDKALPLPEGMVHADFYMTLQMLQHCEMAYVSRPISKYRVHQNNFHAAMFNRKRQGEEVTMKIVEDFFKTDQLLTAQDRDDILSRRHLAFADTYFGFGMKADARRCYGKGLRLTKLPQQKTYLRRYAATFIGGGVYDAVKAIFKKIKG